MLSFNRDRYKNAEIPNEPAEDCSATTKRNFKKSLNDEQRRIYALKHPNDDNYLTKITRLASIFKKLGWKPGIDICCVLGGGNATAPFYYDPESDAFC